LQGFEEEGDAARMLDDAACLSPTEEMTVRAELGREFIGCTKAHPFLCFVSILIFVRVAYVSCQLQYNEVSRAIESTVVLIFLRSQTRLKVVQPAPLCHPQTIGESAREQSACDVCA
jgi:hypothetical protein